MLHGLLRVDVFPLFSLHEGPTGDAVSAELVCGLSSGDAQEGDLVSVAISEASARTRSREE